MLPVQGSVPLVAHDVPPEVREALLGERVDFLVKASASGEPSTLQFLGIFGSVFTGVALLVGGLLLGPLLLGESVPVEVNGREEVATPDNWSPVIPFLFMVGGFALLGLGSLAALAVLLLRPGPWFAGTPQRLVRIAPGDVRRIAWSEFSGDSRVRGTDARGTLTLGMRTFSLGKHGRRRYHTLTLRGIPNAATVERLCRERIEAHDPVRAR